MTEERLARGNAARVAVVTGAGTGIGAGIAVALAEAGWDLLLHYRTSADAVEEVAARCRAQGRRVELQHGDFAAKPASAAAVVDTAVERFGRIDLLVNNAAITDGNGPFDELSGERFGEILAANLVAPFLATQAAARHMIAAGRGGRVINIGSVHARQSVPDYAAYEASKAGIVSLTASSAIALAGHGVTVNCVAPGSIVVERYGEGDWDRAWIESRTPIGRLGTPRDIAAMVVFLASDAAGFVDGETIYVDGGMTRRMPLAR